MPPSREERRIRTLADTARALARPERLPRLLEVAAEGARQGLAAATVSMSRVVPGTLTGRTVVTVGDLPPGRTRWPEDETHVLHGFEGLPRVVAELQPWSWDPDGPDRPDGAWPGGGARAGPAGPAGAGRAGHDGPGLSAPLVVDGRSWGELYATRHRDEAAFDDLDEAYVEALLAVLAGAVARVQREQSLEQLAYRDPLTGLPNRRALDEHAARAFAPEPGSRTLTAITFDINRLKHVNDTLGHAAGDRLIRTVAHELHDAFGALPDTVVARVGGDEFTVLVVGADPAEAVAVADRLCVRTRSREAGAGVSAGAATVTVGGSGPLAPTDLFAAADRAQYVAKRGGLTTTVLSAVVVPPPEDPDRPPR